MSLKSVIKKFFINPRQLLQSTKHPLKMKRFFRDMRAYNKNNKRPEFHASLRNMWPCLNEWDAPAGSLGVYFYQDLWAAKKIFQVKPSEHFDIGSRVDGLNFIQADATNLDNTCSQ